MPFPPICLPIEHAFEIIRQTILDTYRIDSILLRFPYSKFERLDMGLRRLAWGTYSTQTPLFALNPGKKLPAGQMIVLKSNLGFYNLIVIVSGGKKPDLFAFMPFRTEPATIPAVSRIMKKNGISSQHMDSLYHVYSNIPVVDLTSMLTTLQHLLAAFFSAFSESNVEYVNYSSERHEININEERIEEFTSDYVELFTAYMKQCMDAIISGNLTNATEKMKSLLDFAFSIENNSSLTFKKHLLDLNTFITAKMLDTQVHPHYVLKQSHSFQLKIDATSSMEELRHLPYEMARKYCMLAKNYTYENYSLLVRNAVNYIDQHLSGDLSLSAIAAEFGKNASYLSNVFKKEVGETLTSYVCRQRIQASLRYFNTTDMSIADVATSVGYTDFGYFSKMFKKYVGSSPRDYKKMLGK